MDKPTVQNILAQALPDYIKHYPLSFQQSKVTNAILKCKTGELGANVSVCEECGTISTHYNSCRNRHCPMCQALPTAKWIDREQEDVLNVPYFHAVFTVPDDLIAPLIYSNQKLLYSTMYHAASETLLELAEDPKYLGARIGVICVLHTWGSDMHYHPHIHAIVMGGGLNAKGKWVSKGNRFYIPVAVMSKLFRGKFMEELKRLYNDGLLEFHGSAKEYQNSYKFKELVNKLYKIEWVPYIKKTFNGAMSVIKYLGKYTHRIAISNYRLVNFENGTVRYKVKNYKNKGRWKEITLPQVEFVRRFLMHVLPTGFVRIRHYGLLASRVKTNKMTLCRNLIGCEKYTSSMREMNTEQILKHLFHVDVHKCTCCGGRMQAIYSTRYHLRC